MDSFRSEEDADYASQDKKSLDVGGCNSDLVYWKRDPVPKPEVLGKKEQNSTFILGTAKIPKETVKVEKWRIVKNIPAGSENIYQVGRTGLKQRCRHISLI